MGVTVKRGTDRDEWYSVHDRNRQSAGEDNQYYSINVLRWRLVNRPHVWRPPTDVFETEEYIIVRVEIAGMREEDFAISLDDRRLMISGVRPDQPERRAFYQMEIPYGEFSTEVELPVSIIAERIEAVYCNGFLKIRMPKASPHFIHATSKE